MVGNMLSSMKKADPSSPLSDFSNNDELDKVDRRPGLPPVALLHEWPASAPTARKLRIDTSPAGPSGTVIMM